MTNINKDQKITPKQFVVESSPHIFSSCSKKRIMWIVFCALIPSALMGIYNFGLHALLIILTSLIVAFVSESLFNKLAKKTFSRMLDGSWAVTGLLLGMTLPPTVPLWIPAIGAFVALAIGKHIFGGAGMTLFNPALVGRAFLVVSFPSFMSKYIWPHTMDAITSASPLSTLKNQGYQSAISIFGSRIEAYWSMFIGNTSGCIGETSAMLLLLGGLILIFMRIIDWKIPLLYIGTVFIGALALNQDPVFHILGGALFIGAFFMATDYAGMPLTQKGRIYFGIGLGLLTILIRQYSSYPEAVNFVILLMNMTTPLIDRFTISKPFGYKTNSFKNSIKLFFKNNFKVLSKTKSSSISSLTKVKGDKK
jgi:Na+-translocating ferredoxin:NAD+ oxidoreductase subunit D